MTESSRLASATALLRAAYGSPDLDDSISDWSILVRLLLLGSSADAASGARAAVLNSPLLNRPAETAQANTGALVELLTPVPRGPQKASLLRSVAAWWQNQFGDETSPEWSTGTEFYRESLRKIRGLGPATVDELLMFVARLPLFPLDRGTLRVAVRHGWLDLPLEDQDAQSFFIQGLRESAVDPREFSQLISQVAESHCGREPKCDGCPLQPLLPENGPLNPDSC